MATPSATPSSSSSTPVPSSAPIAEPTLTKQPDTSTPAVLTQTPTLTLTLTPVPQQTSAPNTDNNLSNNTQPNDSKAQLKTIKLSSVVCREGAKKISGKVSVSGAAVKIKVGSKAYKKAAVKGKKFSLKVAKLKKKTKVTIAVTKAGYKKFVKVYKVK